MTETVVRKPLPPWLKVSVPSGEKVSRIRRTCAERGLHTVCASARCGAPSSAHRPHKASQRATGGAGRKGMGHIPRGR